MFTQLLIAKSGCAEEQRKEFYFIWFTCRVNLCPAQFSFDHNLLDFAYHSLNLSNECSVLIDYMSGIWHWACTVRSDISLQLTFLVIAQSLCSYLNTQVHFACQIRVDMHYFMDFYPTQFCDLSFFDPKNLRLNDFVARLVDSVPIVIRPSFYSPSTRVLGIAIHQPVSTKKMNSTRIVGMPYCVNSAFNLPTKRMDRLRWLRSKLHPTACGITDMRWSTTCNGLPVSNPMSVLMQLSSDSAKLLLICQWLQIWIIQGWSKFVELISVVFRQYG